MHYELWGLHPANLIASTATEQEALGIVRELLSQDWTADELSLGLAPDAGEEIGRASLPAWEGAALLERLHIAA